jgi:Tfp pilus assembly protein PilF
MKKAGEYVARARELDASSNEIVFNSGLAAWRAGDAAAAARWLRQVLQSNGQDNLVRRLLTAVAEKLPPDQAEALKPPSSGELPAEITTEPTENELAAADRLMREWDETAARFAVLESQPAADISPRPRHGEIHLRRGREALTRGDLEAARQELSQALLLEPNSYEAHYSLGEVYRRLGRPAEAIRELKAALSEQDLIEARLLLASIYVDEQKWSEAEAEARSALRLDATNQEARELLAAAVARSRPPRQGRGDRPAPSAEKEP